ETGACWHIRQSCLANCKARLPAAVTPMRLAGRRLRMALAFRDFVAQCLLTYWQSTSSPLSGALIDRTQAFYDVEAIRSSKERSHAVSEFPLATSGQSHVS